MTRTMLENKIAKDRNGEKGAALVTAILALLLVTLLGVALMNVGQTSKTIASNDFETTEAFFVAEAGMNHSLRILRAQGVLNFTAILRNGVDSNRWDNLANTGEITIVDPIPEAGSSLPDIPGNAYTVQVFDDNDGDSNVLADTNGRIMVRVTGVGRNGATTTIEGLVGALPQPAILVDGRLRISGNPRITGIGGAVHSNLTMDFDGSPCAEQYFSSASNIVDPGNADTGPGCTGNDVRPAQNAITVPNYDPANWALDATDEIPQPDIIFSNTGIVYVRNGLAGFGPGTASIGGTVPAIAGYTARGGACSTAPCSSGDFTERTAGGAEMQKWSFDGGTDKKEWVLSGNNLVGGRTYYIRGNMTIGGNPGTAASPIQVTFMADGYIQFSGNPYITPNQLNPDVQALAGTDLKLNGNPSGSSNNFRGLHYARHQLDVSGNPRISGRLVARDLADTRFPVTASGQNIIQRSSGYMVISGNPTVVYDGGANSFSLRYLNWHEIRN